ncbi:hypothetical protein H6P81_012824 [Aristolochia fimbriata]|uniref:Seipin-1 n=1 Tax=Aristolochia fimbriata TaxID=158543 RepID=A0AAV7EFT0_ARIFI|nr:hypothetical protein H6P81_012824 [Aristolochia fimbriata]
MKSSSLSEEEAEEPLLEKPGELLIELIATRLRLFSDAFVSVLSLASDSAHRAEQAKDHAREAVHEVPARVAYGGGLLLRRLGLGLAGAVHAALFLLLVLLVAVAAAAGLLWVWMEEPVSLTEPLHFDYTQAHPAAALTSIGGSLERRKRLFPAGHTLDVSVVLLMPESDFNRRIGVFQITAEAIAVTGQILARSSQPCMLRFRSHPIRLARTFVMGVPLVLGITGETQEITIKLLKYRELGNPRTEAIRIRLQPRASTSSLPELYSSEIRVTSELPWRKALAHKWKWTFYVWTTIYAYIVLLIVLVYKFRRTLIFREPPSSGFDLSRRNRAIEVVKEWQSRVRARGDEDQVSDVCSDSLRRWQRSSRLSKRKTVPRGGAAPLGVSGGASGSGTAREEELSEVVDDSGDWAPSEPECIFQQWENYDSGTDYQGQIIRDRLSGTDYQGQIIRDRLSGTDYQGQIIRDRLSGTDYQGQIIGDRLSGTDYQGQIIAKIFIVGVWLYEKMINDREGEERRRGKDPPKRRIEGEGEKERERSPEKIKEKERERRRGKDSLQRRGREGEGEKERERFSPEKRERRRGK